MQDGLGLRQSDDLNDQHLKPLEVMLRTFKTRRRSSGSKTQTKVKPPKLRQWGGWIGLPYDFGSSQINMNLALRYRAFRSSNPEFQAIS